MQHPLGDDEQLCHGVYLRKIGEWTVVDIDYTADPRKRDPEWALRMRARLGEQRFRREILRDWTVAAGEPYFLEVSKAPELYAFEPPHLLDAPIYVGLDFGLRHPAATWLQYDSVNDRVFVLREWMPAQIDAYSFRDTVLWLSGERRFEELPPGAMRWAQLLHRDPSFPSVPFFGAERTTAMQIHYWAGHEANMQRAEVAAETAERSTAEIWEAAGVRLGVYAVPVAARELTIRKLLTIRPDGWPGLLFSPTCRILIEGFAGGITFAKGTKQNPQPDRAARDGYYEHILDALGYAVVNLSPYRDRRKSVQQRAEPVLPKTRGAYEREVDRVSMTPGLPVKETRASVWSRFRRPY